MSLKVTFLFIFGFVSGYLFSQLFITNSPPVSADDDNLFDEWQVNDTSPNVQSTTTTTRVSTTTTKNNERDNEYDGLLEIWEEETEAPTLEARITCIIITEPQQYNKSLKIINETWAPRCNNFAYYSHNMSGFNNTYGAIEFDIYEKRLWTWPKLEGAFKHAWEKFKDLTDWFLLTDDRNHIIVENIHNLIKNYSTDEPLTICSLLHKDNLTFCNPEAGVILSKDAVSRIVDKGIKNKTCEEKSNKIYSKVLGVCMDKLNITKFEDLDDKGKRTLFPYQPDKHICTIADRADDFDVGYNKGNVTCEQIIVSEYPISFRYYGGGRPMLFSEFFAYHARVFGLNEKVFS